VSRRLNLATGCVKNPLICGNEQDHPGSAAAASTPVAQTNPSVVAAPSSGSNQLSIRLPHAGRYSFQCDVHPFMNGQLIVSAAFSG